MTHPSDGVLGAYLDGELAERDRKQLIEHFADCTECRHIVALAAQTTRGSSAPWWIGAAVAAAAAVLLTIFLGGGTPEEPQPNGTNEVAKDEPELKDDPIVKPEPKQEPTPEPKQEPDPIAKPVSLIFVLLRSNVSPTRLGTWACVGLGP